MGTLLFAESAAGEIARTFGVNWSHLLAQTISFCLVCVILQRFAYRPVLEMLARRRQAIADGLADAEKAEARLAEVDAERTAILQRAGEEAAKLIAEARAAAAEVRAKDIARASAEAEQIIANARVAAVREREKALADLRHDFGRLVVQSATMATGKMLTAEDQARLAEESAKQYAA